MTCACPGWGRQGCPCDRCHGAGWLPELDADGMYEISNGVYCGCTAGAKLHDREQPPKFLADLGAEARIDDGRRIYAAMKHAEARDATLGLTNADWSAPPDPAADVLRATEDWPRRPTWDLAAVAVETDIAGAARRQLARLAEQRLPLRMVLDDAQPTVQLDATLTLPASAEWLHELREQQQRDAASILAAFQRELEHVMPGPSVMVMNPDVWRTLEKRVAELHRFGPRSGVRGLRAFARRAVRAMARAEATGARWADAFRGLP